MNAKIIKAQVSTFLAKYIMSEDNFYNWGLELDCHSVL